METRRASGDEQVSLCISWAQRSDVFRAEKEVLGCIPGLRSEGCAFSHELLQTHMQAAARVPVHAPKRLCLRRRTTLCQLWPADCEDEVCNFWHFVIRIQGEEQFLLSQTGNEDETAINFGVPRSTMVEAEGAKSVLERALSSSSGAPPA